MRKLSDLKISPAPWSSAIMNSPTWTFDKQAFAMDLHEVIRYILRGDAGNETKTSKER